MAAGISWALGSKYPNQNRIGMNISRGRGLYFLMLLASIAILYEKNVNNDLGLSSKKGMSFSDTIFTTTST